MDAPIESRGLAGHSARGGGSRLRRPGRGRDGLCVDGRARSRGPARAHGARRHRVRLLARGRAARGRGGVVARRRAARRGRRDGPAQALLGPRPGGLFSSSRARGAPLGRRPVGGQLRRPAPFVGRASDAVRRARQSGPRRRARNRGDAGRTPAPVERGHGRSAARGSAPRRREDRRDARCQGLAARHGTRVLDRPQPGRGAGADRRDLPARARTDGARTGAGRERPRGRRRQELPRGRAVPPPRGLGHAPGPGAGARGEGARGAARARGVDGRTHGRGQARGGGGRARRVDLRRAGGRGRLDRACGVDGHRGARGARAGATNGRSACVRALHGRDGHRRPARGLRSVVRPLRRRHGGPAGLRGAAVRAPLCAGTAPAEERRARRGHHAGGDHPVHAHHRAVRPERCRWEGSSPTCSRSRWASRRRCRSASCTPCSSGGPPRSAAAPPWRPVRW